MAGGIYIATATQVDAASFSGEQFYLPSGSVKYNDVSSSSFFGIAIADQSADGSLMSDATTFNTVATTPQGSS